jgi:hypothetical protein
MPFVEEIRKKLDTHTAVPLWPDAGIALGLTRGHAYRGAITRDIKVIRTGRLKKGPDLVAPPAARARRATLSSQWVMSGTCSHCGGEFKPLRRSARFCGSTCRVAAHRRMGCNAKQPPEKAAEASRALQNGSGVPPARADSKNAPAPMNYLSVTRRRHAIVPDDRWPGMYRIKRRDGSVTDMVCLTRAKEALL